MNYTLNFAGGSTQSGSLNFSDWFNNPNPAYTANGRINSGGYDSVNSGNPSIYELPIPITFTAGLTLDSVTFTYASGPANTGIFAISGALAQLTWTGTNGIGSYSPSSLPNGTTGVWDSTSASPPAPTANWSGASTTYTDAEAVTFDNTGTNTNIAIQSGGVAPYSVTFDNSSVAYTFTDADGANGITGAATVTLSASAGSITFNSSNSYTGATTITAGTLRINNANALQNSTVTVNVNSSPSPATGLVFGSGVGTFNLGGLAGSGNVALSDTTSPASLPVSLVVGSNNANTTYSGVLGGAGSLTKTGSGVLSLSGVNTYGGTTTITQGTLRLAGIGAPPTAGLSYWLNNNSLSTLANGAAVTTWNDISGNGINFTGSGATYAPGAMNGLGAVYFNGTSAKLASTTNSTVQTVFVVNQQNAVQQNDSYLWGENNADTSIRTDLGTNGGQTGTATYSAWANPGNGGNWTNGGTMYLQGVQESTTANGTAVYALNTASLVEGVHGSAVSTTWGIGQSFNGGGRYFTGYVGEVLAYNGVLSTAEQTAVEDYLNAKWNLEIGGLSTATNVLPTNTAVSLAAGATLDLDSTNQQVASLGDYQTLGNGGTVTNSGYGPAVLTFAPSSGSATFSGVIQNGNQPVGLTMSGTGTQILAGTNTFSGPTTISGGVLQLNNANALQNSTVAVNINSSPSPAAGLVFGGGIGTFNVGGLAGTGNLATTDTNTQPVNLVVGSNNATTTYSGALGGSGSLTKTGSGVLLLSGANTYAGTTAITQGTLQLGGAGAPPTAGLAYWLNNSSLSTLSNGAAVSTWNDTSGNGINFTGSGTTYAAGAMNGMGAVYFNGTSAKLASTTNSTVQTVFVVNQQNAVQQNDSYLWGVNNGDLSIRTDLGGGMTTYGAWANPGNGGNWTNGGSMYVNGVQSLTNNSATYAVGAPSLVEGVHGSTDNATWGIGQSYSGGGRYFTGYVGEVLAYNGTLTTAQQDAVEAYLNAKWGLGITGLPIVTANVLPTTTAVSLAAGATLDLDSTSQQVASLGDYQTLGNGGTVTNSGYGAATLTLAPTSGSTTFSGVIQNGTSRVSLTVNGSGTGTQILAGTNTYTGATTVLGGTLRINGSLPAGAAVTVGGNGASGTPTLGGTGTINGPVTINGTGSGVAGTVAAASGQVLNLVGGLTLQAGSNSSFALGVQNGISNPNNALIFTSGPTNSLIVNGTNTISFTNPQAGEYDLISYTGTTTASNFQLNPASVAAYASLDYSYNLLPGSGQIDLLITAPPVAWSGTNVVNGVTPWDTVTQNWATTAPTAGAATTYGDPGGVVTFGDTYPTDNMGGTASVASYNVYIRNGGVSPALVTFNNSTGNYSLFDSDGMHGIGGAANIVLSGTGTVYLMNPNSFTGSVSINSGVLNVQSPSGGLGASSGVSVAAGAALQLQGGVTIGNVTLSITGTGPTGNGALQSVSGANIYGGLISGNGTITSSSTSPGDGLTLTGSLNPQGNTLTINGPGNTTISTNGVAGTGTLAYTGTGTLTLGAANSFIGPTLISSGTFSVLGSGSLAGNLTYNSGNTSTIAGNLGGAAAVLTANSGTLILTGANTYGGGTTLAGGTIRVGAADTVSGTAPNEMLTSNALGLGTATLSSGTLQDNGSAIALGNSVSLSGNITFSSSTSGSLIFDGTGLTTPATFAVAGTSSLTVNNTTTINDVVSGSANLTVGGSGTLVLGGSNTFTGGTTINSGVVQLNSTNALQNSVVSLNTPGGLTFSTGVGSVALGGLQDGSAAPIDLTMSDLSSPPSPNVALTLGNSNSGGNASYSGKLTASSLTKIGTNTQTLTGNNSFTGTITVSNGTLAIGPVSGGATPLGTAPITLSNTGTLRLLGQISSATLAGFGGTSTSTTGAGTGWQVNTNNIGLYTNTPNPINSNVLTLTDSNNSEARSAFYAIPLSIGAGFTASFNYQPIGTQNAQADGAAFVIQTAGPTALGGTGSSLGYYGIANPSAAAEFNIWQGNLPGGATNPNGSTYIGTNGYVPNQNGNTNNWNLVPFLASGDLVNVQLSYSAGTLSELLTDENPSSSFYLNTAMISQSVNLASLLGTGTAYVGFTGGTGGANATQNISNFSINYTGINSVANYNNNVTLAGGANATIDVSIQASLPTVSMGTLTVNNGTNTTLNITADQAPTGQPYGLTLGTVSLQGNITFDVANNTNGGGNALGTLTLGAPQRQRHGSHDHAQRRRRRDTHQPRQPIPGRRHDCQYQ